LHNGFQNCCDQRDRPTDKEVPIRCSSHTLEREKNLKNGPYRNKSGLHSSGSRKGPVTGSCKHGNEHFGYIKDAEFTD
jgi:hypothetical protein